MAIVAMPDRLDIIAPSRCEVMITNSRVTVEVDRKTVLRVVRAGKVDVDDQRQGARKHYHACIKKAWDSVPERLSMLFPDPDALRKFALVRAGFTDCRVIPLSSEDQAERVAAMVRSNDSFALVAVEASTVCVYTAKSQDGESMQPEEFAASKRMVLEICAEIVGVSVAELSANAGASA